MERLGRACLVAAALMMTGAAGCRTTQPLDMTDPGIDARIRANLAAERELDLRYVTINVHTGVATISGMVPTWQDTITIRRIVENTKGVEQAIVNLINQD